VSNSLLPGVRIHVHDRGDATLDGILRLITAANEPRPLDEALSVMCHEVANIAGVDVVSAYVRESTPDRDLLIMRGNHGFPVHAVNSVRLSLGEGLTGFVAECLRPVSVAAAPDDAHYKPVPGLGEERFPAFLGVPIISRGQAAGVLVLQRRQRRAFSTSEVTLAAALTAPFGSAIERSKQVGQPAAGPRTARLRGQGRAAGTAMGRAVTVPTLNGLRGAPRPAVGRAPSFDLACGHLGADIAALSARLTGLGTPAPPGLVWAATLFQDARFHSHARDQVNSHGLFGGLTRVARDYARARTADEDYPLNRARDVEELCVVLYMKAQRPRLLKTGNVLASQRLGWPLAVVAAAERAGAVVVEEAATDAARAIAQAVRVPLIEGVGSLGVWVHDDDLLVVDGATGSVSVNPSASAVVRFRRHRRG
jgi:phosphotransferase system, enzyme I, PtsP